MNRNLTGYQSDYILTKEENKYRILPTILAKTPLERTRPDATRFRDFL